MDTNLFGLVEPLEGRTLLSGLSLAAGTYTGTFRETGVLGGAYSANLVLKANPKVGVSTPTLSTALDKGSSPTARNSSIRYTYVAEKSNPGRGVYVFNGSMGRLKVDGEWYKATLTLTVRRNGSIVGTLTQPWGHWAVENGTFSVSPIKSMVRRR